MTILVPQQAAPPPILQQNYAHAYKSFAYRKWYAHHSLGTTVLECPNHLTPNVTYVWQF